MRLRARHAIFVCAVTAIASCFVSSVEVIDEAAGSGGGSQSSGPGGMAGAQPKPCQHAYPPDPPAADDGQQDIDFVAAFHSVNVGDNDPDITPGGSSIGYDLDKSCTCEGDGPSCVEPKGSGPKDHCDGPGGIDDAAAKLFASAKPFSTKLSSDSFSKAADSGGWSLLVRVENYNGGKNDTQVTVAIYPSPGIHQNNSCVPMSQSPKWDGTDAWPVDVASLGLGSGPGSNGGDCAATPVLGYSYDKPQYVDPKAYVANGTVVANLPESQLVITGGGTAVIIKLTAGFITGQIEKGPLGYKLTKGIFTGRWKTSDMFIAVGELFSGGMALCTDNPVYGAIKVGICGARDVASSLGGPTTACDAVSFAIAFETDPAKLGPVVQAKTVMDNCMPPNDPAMDSCAP